MILAGGILITLAIWKEYEPMLLLPIGFGCILANIPLTGMTDGEGLFGVLYRAGISTELFPLLIFIGVGAMIDFSPLLAQPRMALMGAAGQFGIYGTLILATLLGFPLNEAASIGVIGAIDGPTSIYVATKLAPKPARPDCRCGLLLHEPGANHPDTDHEAAHHSQGAAHPHGICPAPSKPARSDRVPSPGYPGDRLAGSRSYAADQHADAGQPFA